MRKTAQKRQNSEKIEKKCVLNVLFTEFAVNYKHVSEPEWFANTQCSARVAELADAYG